MLRSTPRQTRAPQGAVAIGSRWQLVEVALDDRLTHAAALVHRRPHLIAGLCVLRLSSCFPVLGILHLIAIARHCPAASTVHSSLALLHRALQHDHDALSLTARRPSASRRRLVDLRRRPHVPQLDCTAPDLC
eukprot:scaffold33345_cov123-Isochrysis_galbana.AAC.5